MLLLFSALCMLVLVVGSAARGSGPAKPHHGHHGHRHARLPPKFFGINPNNVIPSAAEFARMRAGGIRSYRSPINWRTANYLPGRLNWSPFDLLMRRAPAAGIDVVPFIFASPYWVNIDERTMPVGSAGDERAWTGFLRAAIARYGPHGTFWALHPGIPYRPVRYWQLWNEMNIDSFTKPISPAGYGRLLKISRATIKKADPGAKIVIGGLYGEPYQPHLHGDMNDLAFMKRLYRIKGIKSTFDAYALHPYAATASVMRRQIINSRALMKRSGDGATPLWVDEFGWGSGHDISLPSARGPKGQKKQLQIAYRMLRRNRARWKIGRTYWFSWDDAAGTSCAICGGSGLFTFAGKPKPAWYAFVKQTGGKS